MEAEKIAQEQHLELERFKRRLLIEMSALKREGIPNVWPHLTRRMGCDCKALWKRMRGLTLKKLCRLASVGDETNLVPEVARMSSVDWEILDLIISYEEFEIVSMDSYKNYEELRSLISIFHLVQIYEIEDAAVADLPTKWVQATMHYNSSDRHVSAMLLQRRWFELKRACRQFFYGYWRMFSKREDKDTIKPMQIHIAVAKRFPHLITTSFKDWQAQLQCGLVVYPHQIAEVRSDPLAMSRNKKQVDDDLQLIEPHVETIDLELEDQLEYEEDSGTGEVTVKKELERNEDSSQDTDSNDLPDVTLVESNIDPAPCLQESHAVLNVDESLIDDDVTADERRTNITSEVESHIQTGPGLEGNQTSVDINDCRIVDDGVTAGESRTNSTSEVESHIQPRPSLEGNQAVVDINESRIDDDVTADESRTNITSEVESHIQSGPCLEENQSSEDIDDCQIVDDVVSADESQTNISSEVESHIQPGPSLEESYAVVDINESRIDKDVTLDESQKNITSEVESHIQPGPSLEKNQESVDIDDCQIVDDVVTADKSQTNITSEVESNSNLDESTNNLCNNKPTKISSETGSHSKSAPFDQHNSETNIEINSNLEELTINLNSNEATKISSDTKSHSESALTDQQTSESNREIELATISKVKENDLSGIDRQIESVNSKNESQLATLIPINSIETADNLDISDKNEAIKVTIENQVVDIDLCETEVTQNGTGNDTVSDSDKSLKVAVIDNEVAVNTDVDKEMLVTNESDVEFCDSLDTDEEDIFTQTEADGLSNVKIVAATSTALNTDKDTTIEQVEDKNDKSIEKSPKKRLIGPKSWMERQKSVNSVENEVEYLFGNKESVGIVNSPNNVDFNSTSEVNDSDMIFLGGNDSMVLSDGNDYVLLRGGNDSSLVSRGNDSKALSDGNDSDTSSGENDAPIKSEVVIDDTDEEDDIIQLDDSFLKDLEMEHFKLEQEAAENTEPIIEEKPQIKLDKLLMTPLIIMCNIKPFLPDINSTIKLNNNEVDQIIAYSKRRPLMQYEIEEKLQKQKDFYRFIAKIYRNSSKIQRRYSPISLCKNPDFNTRLKRISAGFLTLPTNRKYLKDCKPVTIDLFNCNKLEDKKSKIDCIDTNKVIKEMPAQSLIDSEIFDSDEIAHASTDNDKTHASNDCGNEIRFVAEPHSSSSNSGNETRRSTKILLQDIADVRRINSKLQTAQVPPIKIEKSDSFQSKSAFFSQLAPPKPYHSTPSSLKIQQSNSFVDKTTEIDYKSHGGSEKNDSLRLSETYDQETTTKTIITETITDGITTSETATTETTTIETTTAETTTAETPTAGIDNVFPDGSQKNVALQLSKVDDQATKSNNSAFSNVENVSISQTASAEVIAEKTNKTDFFTEITQGRAAKTLSQLSKQKPIKQLPVPWFQRTKDYFGENLITPDTLAKMIVSLSGDCKPKNDIQFCCQAKKQKVLSDARKRYLRKIQEVTKSKMAQIKGRMKPVRAHLHKTPEECDCCCKHLLSEESMGELDGRRRGKNKRKSIETIEIDDDVVAPTEEVTIMESTENADAVKSIEALNSELVKETELTAMPEIPPKPKRPPVKRKRTIVNAFDEERSKSSELFGFKLKRKPAPRKRVRVKIGVSIVKPPTSTVDLSDDDVIFLEPNVADDEPNIANDEPNFADVEPNVTNMEPNVANVEPSLADFNPKIVNVESTAVNLDSEFANNQFISATPVNVVISDDNQVKLKLQDNTELSIDVNSLAPEILSQITQGMNGDLMLINPSAFQGLSQGEPFNAHYPNLQSFDDLLTAANPSIVYSTPEQTYNNTFHESPIESSIIEIDANDDEMLAEQSSDPKVSDLTETSVNDSVVSINSDHNYVDVEAIPEHSKTKYKMATVKSFKKIANVTKSSVLDDLLKASGISFSDRNESESNSQVASLNKITAPRVPPIKKPFIINKKNKQFFTYDLKTGTMIPVKTKRVVLKKLVSPTKKPRSLLKTNANSEETINLDSDEEPLKPPQQKVLNQSLAGEKVLNQSLAGAKVLNQSLIGENFPRTRRVRILRRNDPVPPVGSCDGGTVVTRSDSYLTVAVMSNSSEMVSDSFKVTVQGNELMIQPSGTKKRAIIDDGSSSEDEPLESLKRRKEAEMNASIITVDSPVTIDEEITTCEAVTSSETVNQTSEEPVPVDLAEAELGDEEMFEVLPPPEDPDDCILGM